MSSGYPPYGGGGNPPQYPPPQNQWNPQQAQGYQGQYPPYQQPGQPGVNPTAPGQPGFNPTYQPGYNPSYPGAPPMQQGYGFQVEWIPTTPQNANALSNRAVVGGYEGHDGSPLWVIRSRFEGDVIPGKLAIKHQAAYVAWGGRENAVQQFEVCCAPPDRVRWVESRDGSVPPNAVQGGNTASGEPLFVGRAKEQGSLTPGKIHPSHQSLYIPFAGKEVPHKIYEVLVTV